MSEYSIYFQKLENYQVYPILKCQVEKNKYFRPDTILSQLSLSMVNIINTTTIVHTLNGKKHMFVLLPILWVYVIP